MSTAYDALTEYEPTLRAEAARRWLPDFCALMDPQYQSARHTRMLCDHLMAVERGDVHRLMVFLPPRSSKSYHVSQRFPAWYMGRHPSDQLILLSYGDELAEDNSRKVRNLMREPEYPFRARVAEDSRAVNRWATDQGGIVVAAGVKGTVTGRGANCIVAGTAIQTARGPMTVEAIYDEVMAGRTVQVASSDPAQGVQYRDVVAARKEHAGTLIRIATESGRTLMVTPEHRVYVAGRSAYVTADEVEAGDALLTYGDPQRLIPDMVVAITTVDSDALWPVYDIQVDGNENYFANQTLVHNCLIIDDPVKDREDADSESQRNKTWEAYTDVAITRLQPNGKIVLCQTRWHDDDLAGRLLNSSTASQWTILEMPAIDDEGQALWPEWFDLEYLTKLKEEIGTRSWNALYMQRPQATEGGTFKREWFARRHAEKDLTGVKFRQIIQTVDSSFKTGVSNDPSVIQTWGTDGIDYYLLDLWRKKVEFPELIQAIQAEFLKDRAYGRPRMVLVEDTAAGQSAIQVLRRGTSIPVIPGSVRESKEARAEAVTPLFEAGKVSLPARHPLVDEFVDELSAFPTGRHDDHVDCASAALKRLRGAYQGSLRTFLSRPRGLRISD